jgi:hypothetical protein
MADLTNDKALKKGLKEVENLGILAPAILRERLVTLCKMNLEQIKKDPSQYNNPVFNAGQYEKVLTTFVNAIDFN